VIERGPNKPVISEVAYVICTVAFAADVPLDTHEVGVTLI
jgi:hypothetical protein